MRSIEEFPVWPGAKDGTESSRVSGRRWFRRKGRDTAAGEFTGARGEHGDLPDIDLPKPGPMLAVRHRFSRLTRHAS